MAPSFRPWPVVRALPALLACGAVAGITAFPSGCPLRRACDAITVCEGDQVCFDRFCIDPEDAPVDAGVTGEGEGEEGEGEGEGDVGEGEGEGDVGEGEGEGDVGEGEGEGEGELPDAGVVDLIVIDEFDRDEVDGWGAVDARYDWVVSANSAAFTANGQGVINTANANGFSAIVLHEDGAPLAYRTLEVQATLRAQYGGAGQATRLDLLFFLHNQGDGNNYEFDLQFEADALIAHIDRGPDNELLSDVVTRSGDFHDVPVDVRFRFGIDTFEAAVAGDGFDDILIQLQPPADGFQPTAGAVVVALVVNGDVAIEFDRIELNDIE